MCLMIKEVKSSGDDIGERHKRAETALRDPGSGVGSWPVHVQQ